MTEEEQVAAAIEAAIESGVIQFATGWGIAIAALVFTCIFVVLPWMFLHYLTKARQNGAMSQDDERMLEDIWRSSRTMERRIETLEELIKIVAGVEKSFRYERPRGGLN